jgi:transglutaminase/protease-like cytokinesis protein 3
MSLRILSHCFYFDRTAGLESKIITGYAKGAGYVPGMKLTKDSSAVHSWNVAMVDGKWKLFDCHWAARRLVGRSTAQEHVLYCVDEFYYMPDPNHLKWTHHPFEEEWQLTVNPLTLEVLFTCNTVL